MKNQPRIQRTAVIVSAWAEPWPSTSSTALCPTGIQWVLLFSLTNAGSDLLAFLPACQPCSLWCPCFPLSGGDFEGDFEGDCICFLPRKAHIYMWYSIQYSHEYSYNIHSWKFCNDTPQQNHVKYSYIHCSLTIREYLKRRESCPFSTTSSSHSYVLEDSVVLHMWLQASATWHTF